MDAIVADHGLEPTPYGDVSAWAFGDAVFSWDYDLIADGSKARRLGFHEYVETEQMFTRIFDELRSRNIIPPHGRRDEANPGPRPLAKGGRHVSVAPCHRGSRHGRLG